MVNQEQIAGLPALREARRERPSTPISLELSLASAAPQTDNNEATTTIGPFLAALLRALSARAT